MNVPFPHRAGVLLGETEDTIRLLETDADGGSKLVEIALEKIEEDLDGSPMIQQTQISTMPDGFQDLRTEDEIEAIVAFIKCFH